MRPMPSHAPTNDEAAFQQWYQQMAAQYGLSPDPDDPQQFYDYRSAFKAGAKPDETGHWPSDFKKEGHPNLVVGGFHVQTGKRVPGTQRAFSVEELVKLGWEPETAKQLHATPEPLMPAHSVKEHADLFGPKRKTR